MQSRLAAVRYKGVEVNANPTRGSQVRDSDEAPLPTPEPSSQVQEETIAESNVRLNGAEGENGNTHSEQYLEDEDEDDDDDLITPVHKRRKLSAGTPVSTKISPPPRRSTRLNAGSSPLSTVMGPGAITTPAHSSPLERRSSRLKRGQPSVSSTRSARSPSVQTLASVEIITPPQQRSSNLSDLGSAETSDEDDRILASQPASRRRQSRVVKDTRVVNDDELEYLSDEPRKTWGSRSRRNLRDEFVVDDEEIEYLTSDEDDAVQTRPAKVDRPLSSMRKSRNSARRRKREEQDELDDDLQNLQDSDEDLTAIQTRTRGGPVTTKRDQTKEHFEMLRRRRAGEKIPRVEDPDDEFDDVPPTHLDLIGYPDYDENGSVHSSIDTEPEQDLTHEEEDGFVVEDSTGRLGRPNNDIPLQFTSFASAKPRELFIHIIEWLVKNKIAPAFSREDELYSLAFSRVDDQVKAQAGSRLISAAWGNEFKRAILARPVMKVSMLPGSHEDNVRTCDACNKINHPAQYEFIFSGQPYYKRTLEPIDDSSDDGYDVDEDVDRDENGHILPSVNRRFYLGRFCAANADMGHKLTHWKHRLNDSVLTYLEEQGVLSADTIVAREKLNKKKREKQAEDIVDTMQETGMIADLWADFANELNDARIGMEGFDRKGGRSKGRVGAVRRTVDGTTTEWDRDRVRVARALESDSDAI